MLIFFSLIASKYTWEGGATLYNIRILFRFKEARYGVIPILYIRRVAQIRVKE